MFWVYFGMRHFCLVTYRKKNHHILPSGCIHLMEGMSAWNCTVKTKSVLMSNTLPFTFFFHICAVSELPRISYQSGRHIYYSCLFVACILSAGVHRRAEHPVCFIFFCLARTNTGRIFLYVFSFLLWNWITVLLIVFNSWKCWGYPIAEVSYFKLHMPGKVCGIPPA